MTDLSVLEADLPAGLADPLHLSLPVPWKLLGVLAALLVASIVWVLLRRWLARRRRAPRRSLPEPAPATAPGLAEAIDALRRRYRKSRAYRRACHELSALMRGSFEQSTRRGYSTLTAGEMRSEIGDTRTVRFFGFLADLQFGRREPTRNDLDGACELALEVAKPGAGR